jgi:hypothetical protein
VMIYNANKNNSPHYPVVLIYKFFHVILPYKGGLLHPPILV